MNWIKVFLSFVTVLGTVQAVDWDVITSLDEYVNRDDPYYSWEVVDRQEGEGFTLHVINMTSQKWKDETLTREPIWWHFLNIFVPHTVAIRDAMYLHVGNGNWDDPNPSIDSNWMRRTSNICKTLGVVSAYLRTVPFQPLHFLDRDGNFSAPRTEDLIIGHTWKLYIEAEEPDPEIVVLVPMTKAAKKAVDTVVDFMAQEYTGFAIDKVFPTGFSKRGWVTWLLGCVDKRVFAMAPTVLDLLNMQDNLEHHYRAFGGWSWAFSPYWVEDVSKYLYHPRVPDLAKIVDPYEYNERLTMPKLLFAAVGDEFFLPDDTHYFWEGLTEPKYFRTYENDEHSVSNHWDDRDANIISFFTATYRGDTLPQVTWTRSENATHGTITVQTRPSVLTIGGWYADTTNETCEERRNDTCRRDFRVTALRGKTGIMWYPVDVLQIGIDRYQLVMSKREDFGYRGFFIEMSFSGPDSRTSHFTTEVNIIPDNFPYPKCESEEECRGRLV